jgi:hypothetical protein
MAIHLEVNAAMHCLLRILKTLTFFLAGTFVWFAAIPALADSGGGKPEEGSITDYFLSYLVVFAGIVLGVLVVANTSRRRTRERPAGYVEKNVLNDE